MPKKIEFIISSCQQCPHMIHKTDVKRPGFYCRITGSWIKSVYYLNDDCVFPDAEESD